jgi:hypothetical protein
MPHTWSDNKVHKLIAVKVLHTSLLNIIVVAFKILPFRSYALMPVPGMAFRTAIILPLTSSMSTKCLPFNISFIFGKRKKSLGLDTVNREGVPAKSLVY